MVKFFRDLLNIAAPGTLLLTETNVPHAENISYLGQGGDEAQMVYNFTLPPLLLHGLYAGDATRFSQWTKGLSLESDQTTFFNFTASHDGIGVRPLEGILADDEIEMIIGRVKKNGGQVSYKQNPDGSRSPYELNITYLDALRDGEHDSLHETRFLASQAVQLLMPGVPGIYIHSLLGSRNWVEGVKQTGRARTINREKLEYEQVLSELRNQRSSRYRIFYAYTEMIRKRRMSKAFHPNAEFRVLELDRRIFAVQRNYGTDTVFALVNFCPESVEVALTEAAGSEKRLQDMITGVPVPGERVLVPPYGSLWLTPNPD
jgi:sucrose phosphorylase